MKKRRILDFKPKKINEYELLYDDKDRLYIPPSLTNKFLTNSHHTLGHPGDNKLRNTLKEYYLIKDLNKEAKTITDQCIPCYQNKINNPKYGEIQGFLKAQEIGERISTDIFGPFELDTFGDQGKGYILTITDILSRFS